MKLKPGLGALTLYSPVSSCGYTLNVQRLQFMLNMLNACLCARYKFSYYYYYIIIIQV